MRLFSNRAVTTATGDEARFKRYRDLRSGGLLDRFRFEREKGDWLFAAGADHVGYRDQRYSADLNKVGRLKVSFPRDEGPLFYSETTCTLYSEQARGLLRIADSLVDAAWRASARIRAAALPHQVGLGAPHVSLVIRPLSNR